MRSRSSFINLKILAHTIIYVILWCLTLNKLNSYKITVKNENDLINGLSKTNYISDELIINIRDVTLEFLDDIKVESSVKNYISLENLKKLQ